MASKMVYSFGGSKTDGNGGMRNLLGGKGANLAEMARLGLPVPAGFTITTDVCTAFYESGKKFPSGLAQDVESALALVEKSMGAKFGSVENPLLVSCRSGARISMPGMMDTVLNIGLNDQTVAGLIAKTGNPRFAYDSYRRFVAMYGDVVMGIKEATKADSDPFGHILDELKRRKGYKNDTELTADDLKGLVGTFKGLISDVLKKPFPEDPLEQLWGAIGAVFDSWMIPRAKSYRQLNSIPEDWGTAVNVQAMVFGNMGNDSATGVAFSRDPSTGENYFYGEYLINAQGEDVVAGVRTPNPINRAKPLPAGVDSTLADDMPKIYAELDAIRLKLEKHYRDMQDIEFTIQEGKLFMLQCRNGKRTGHAALKIAMDLVKEKLITRQEAIARFDPEHMTQILLPVFDAKDARVKDRTVLAKGLPASPGAAVGQAAFSAADAEAQANAGRKVILVRLETSPEDIKGMAAAQGILTARGGMTSHAAVVARGMGRTCVAGASITVDYQNGRFSTAKGEVIKAGDWISLNGSTGEVIKGALPTKEVALGDEFFAFMDWIEAEKRMKVRTNADTPKDAQVARSYGAEGIGLCRTEHMFFESDRIDHVRAMILADTPKDRQKALAAILPMQRDDFLGIFKAMDGLPVTIRTLDPPLHEFLPHTDGEIADLAKKFSLPLQKVKDRIDTLHEQNPMLGLRGCRLGILYPEITSMQARAIFEAAVKATEEGIKVLPEIMIPLIGNEKEFALQKAIVEDVAREILAKSEAKVDYLIGTMIELPRAALVADKVVRAGAQFFSFGTNDLTQTTFGLSRDDSGVFLPKYLESHIWDNDPFVSIDVEGLGQLIEMGVTKGRQADHKLKIGICGEHGGDPSSVKFCFAQGFDYVSCSPHRVPVARLASAQASISQRDEDESLEPGQLIIPAHTIIPFKRPSKAGAPRGPRKMSSLKKELIKKVSQAIGPATKQAVQAIMPKSNRDFLKKLARKANPAAKKPRTGPATKVAPKGPGRKTLPKKPRPSMESDD
ncbi:MAG: pyruvate, phosphate dikinase [Deltaproteobacteria bacterium]|nr:pyruvate, phosphate dikinase [Deltaproteobacteria bacterium]